MMPDFNQWVKYAELTDYQLSNQIFTWSIAISYSKLDRILIDESREGRYPKVKAATLPKTICKHNPILLECSIPVHQVRPFGSKLIWFNRDSFKLLVSQFWERPDDTRFYLKRLARKLRSL